MNGRASISLLSVFKILAWLALGIGGLTLATLPESAPVLVMIGLGSAFWPLAVAERRARGTALRPMIAWALLSVALGMIAQGVARDGPVSSGRPAAGAWAYLAMLASLAATITACNARRPGGGAWAILMGLLILVFCIPWLEGSGLAQRGARWGPPRLDAPWNWFLGVLIVAGATNYAPTRYGAAALVLALSMALAGFARGRPSIEASMASVAPWGMALAIWTAEACSRGSRGPAGTDRLWHWFRDHWGVVWALRVQDRFNRAAETGSWGVRLGWFGLEPHASAFAANAPEAAEATLQGLLRRFADAERIGAEARATPP